MNRVVTWSRAALPKLFAPQMHYKTSVPWAWLHSHRCLKHSLCVTQICSMRLRPIALHLRQANGWLKLRCAQRFLPITGHNHRRNWHVTTPGQTMKLTDLLNEYLAFRFMRSISADNYRNVVSRFLSSKTINDSTLEVETLTEIKMAQWRDEIIHERKRSLVTYNNYRQHLNVLLRYATKRGYISKNPLEVVGKAKSPVVLPKCIDFATFDAAIARLNVHASDKSDSRATRLKPLWYWQAVLKTLLLTGMRRGQLIGLRWGDVDFERALIRLRHETSKNHVEHFIPLFPQLREDFLNLRRHALEVRRTIRDSDQVFDCAHFRDLAKYGGRSELNVNDIKAFFRKLSEEIGVKITPHRLRHTAATELAMSTLDLRAIQKLLGHQTDRTTLTYIRGKTDDIQNLWDRRCSLGGVSRHVDKAASLRQTTRAN
ncbi:MAG: hypothetical protein EAZ21_14755 [Betaproteobacteria bacterium]|nr:MAG: hypothetical protein EAZ21_14755 [Betaproteobacteria bacterium]